MDEALDSIVLGVHRAALDASEWPVAVERIRNLLNAEQAMLFAPARADDDYWLVSINQDPGSLIEYAAEFNKHDLWLSRGCDAECLSTTAVNTSEGLVERDRFMKSPFFNDFLRRYDIERLVNVVLRGPDCAGEAPQAVMSMYRGVGKPEFGERECAILSYLAPHLAVAARTFWWTQREIDRRRAFEAAFESASVAILSIDPARRVLSANKAADSILRRGDLLRVHGGRLCCGHAVRNTKVIERGLNGLLDGHGAIELLDVPGERGRTLTLSPLTRSATPFVNQPQPIGLIFVSAAAPSASMLERFEALFELSPAEARLLRQFVSTEDLNLAAQALNRSKHTARCQMKSILKKSGQRTQVQLLALINRMPVIGS